MLILRSSESKYIVALDSETWVKLELLATYFHKGDTVKMLEDIIKDGITIAISIKAMDEDKEYKKACLGKLNNEKEGG